VRREFRERRSLIKGKDYWIGENGSVVLREVGKGSEW
jgi:hypothetical protein